MNSQRMKTCSFLLFVWFRSHDDSSLERQPVSAENLFQHRRYLKSGKKKDFLMISKVSPNITVNDALRKQTL